MTEQVSVGGALTPPVPGLQLLARFTVELARPLWDLGRTTGLGRRRIVPITGGRFEGPELRGRVMPGGADRQLVRRDGAVNLDATYELQTDDGVVISVRNRVLSRQPKEPANAQRYAFSTLDIVARTAATAGSTTGRTSARCTASGRDRTSSSASTRSFDRRP